MLKRSRPLLALALTALTAAAVTAVTAAAARAQSPTTRPAIPPTEATAKASLEASPRHGEWVDVPLPAGRPAAAPAAVHCWVVYPETKDKAPVVVVIQEIFGLTDWLRGTGDRLAGEGFITITPDLLSGQGPGGGGTDSFGGRDAVTKAVSGLKPDAVAAMLDVVADYGRALPAASGKTAAIGFCWGGGSGFAFAARRADLAAAVVCYGTPPADPAAFAAIKAPVLGLYGGDDARVTSTVPKAEAAMKAAGKSYEPHVFAGAGHGFFRQQDGRDGANLKAAQEGWARAVAFLKEKTA